MSNVLITLDKEYVVRHWMRFLNCTHEELVSAVSAVGKEPEKVRAYLETIPLERRDTPLSRRSASSERSTVPVESLGVQARIRLRSRRS